MYILTTKVMTNEPVKPITDVMRAMLDVPLPPEALKQHPTKTFLTTINPAYVIERLNDVFGVGTWYQETREVFPHAFAEHATTSEWVVVHSTLHIPAYGVQLQTYGGNDNKDMGDAYKGAQTDALTKAASMLGIGAHVWMNKKGVESSVTHSSTPSVSKGAVEVTPPPMEKPCAKCGTVMKYIPAGISQKTGKEYSPFYSCSECKITIKA